jgi:hypothetical protein
MAETPDPKGGEQSDDLENEFRVLGKNLGNFMRSVWESEERKRLQSELEAGLSDFTTSIDQAAKDFKESPAGQRIKEEATDLHERVKSGETTNAMKEDMLSILRKINSELEKVGGSKK